MKKRRSVPLKIRALLQQEVASACPFCDSSDVDHFEIHHIDDDPNNNDAANLMMLCPTCHSKITKGDIPSHVVRRKKLLLRNSTSKSAIPSSQVNKFYGPIETAIVGNHNAITYKINATQKQKYPPGCIGYNSLKANYVSYLINRYHDLKKWEVGGNAMNYAIFPSSLKKKFKIGATRTIFNIPEGQFEILAAYIQNRIRGTKLARTKPQQRYFVSFDEYADEIAYQVE
jgi:hypothetical protein